MRNYVILLLVACFINCGIAFASYDIILTGIEEYNTPVSYSNKTILVTGSAYIIYDCNLILENCTIDVNGSLECNSNITLVNSVIRTEGSFKVCPGTTIAETGASSIIATGNPQCTGKVNIEGELGRRITIISDYIPGSDAEFIVFDANASSDSSLKFTDFYGGWCNVQIYDKRLNDAISGCRFYGAKYAVWQDGIDELTDISFSLFYHNNTSIYFGVDGIYRTNVNPSIDNVIIDGNSSNSYGIVLAGGQNPSYLDYLKLTNSIITNCYCGWYIDVEEYFYPPIISNIAYYGNTYNDNLSDSSFQKNPMYLTQSPFEAPGDPNGWPYFIRSDSPVADVNLGYDLWQSAPQQLVTSLYKNSTPRTDKGIGVGVPISSEHFSNVYEIEGDFDGTGRVNFFDYSIFALEWGSKKDIINYSIADFNEDGDVDIDDLSVFCQYWLNDNYVAQADLDGSKSIDFGDILIIAENWLGAGDGDINKDGIVNFKDFSFLAQYWDEDVAGAILADFNADNIVNFLDYVIFARKFQTIEPNSIHFPDPNGYSIADFDKNGEVNVLDLKRFTANWLSDGGVYLTVDDNESSLIVTCQSIQDMNVAYYAFFLDEKYIASRDSQDNPILIIDKMRYSKGTHHLRAVIKTDGNEYLTVSQSVLFNSPLHNLSFDELFDPSKKFTIKGKLDEGYSAILQIENLDNTILWSNNYTSDFIAVVDANVFSAGAVSYTLSYSYAPTVLGSIANSLSLEGVMLSSSGSASGESSILALDGPPSYQTAGLIICMMEDGMKDGSDTLTTGTCLFASRKWQGHAKPIILRGYGENNQVRHGMINKVFRKYRNIRYGHIYAHGNYLVGIYGFRDRRTALSFNDGIWVAFNSRTWTDQGLAVPDNYVWLSDELENADYLNRIPFAYGQLRIMVIESCYALRNVVTINGDGSIDYENWVYDYELQHHINSHYAYPNSDVTFGLNIHTTDQMVLGGGDVIIKGGLYPYYSRFFNVFWRSLSEGNTVHDAMQDAKAVGSAEVIRCFRWRGAGSTLEMKL